jgi:hypothetical protein
MLLVTNITESLNDKRWETGVRERFLAFISSIYHATGVTHGPNNKQNPPVIRIQR